MWPGTISRDFSDDNNDLTIYVLERWRRPKAAA
jgi:hypothetical protein